LAHAVLGILAGFVSGVMSGAFGVGGAILTTPAVRVLLDAPPLVAVGTPLPAIFPTTVAGARAYRKAGLVDARAVRWLAPPGVAAAALGAILTKVINAHVLLLATAALIGWQAVNVGVGRSRQDQGEGAPEPSSLSLALTGAVAGFASGLLGIGGGVILVPAMSGVLHMPLKRAVGTSLVVIAFMVVPGTLVHAILGHINWTIFLWLTLGVVPGAMLGSHWTIHARERTLRLVVAVFLSLVAILYAILELHDLITGR
jgi:uncharacterized membrane protein YfcA